MVLLGFIAGSVLIGCVLYLPFFIWFRRRPPTGSHGLAVKVHFTRVGWLHLTGQMAALFAGLYLFGNGSHGGDLVVLAHSNAALLKWWLGILVVFSAAAVFLERQGIALRQPETTPTAPLSAGVAARASRPYRLATIRGVPIFVQRSYLFGGLFIGLLATNAPMGVLGYCVAWAALIAIHEAGHAVVAQCLGLKVHAIELSGIRGLCRVAVPKRPRDVWLVFSAGLAAQAAVLLATLAAVAALGPPESAFGMAVMTAFTWVNAMLFAINLLPGRMESGLLTDGAVLWGMARHQFGSAPHPIGWHSVPTRLFDPSTSLLGIHELVPAGFRIGVEILNDTTTPMEFVTEVLERHAGLAHDAATSTMLDIHMRGGVLLAFTSREAADAVAAAINQDVQARGHHLMCRAVSADACAVVAASLPGG